MLLNSFNLILSIVIATCLVILQETMSNMFWLITIDMPVTIGIVLNTYFSNLFLMNLGGAIPIIALIAIGFLVAYLVTKILLIWVNLSIFITWEMGATTSGNVKKVRLATATGIYFTDVI